MFYSPARLSVNARRVFGKGRPAALNFGDCFSYALSKSTGEPLLFKGPPLSTQSTSRVISCLDCKGQAKQFPTRASPAADLAAILKR